MKKGKKKSAVSTIVLVLIFVVGLSLVLYPTFADYINSLHQSRAITSYSSSVAGMSDEDYTETWEAARQYNEDIPNRRPQTMMTDEEYERYRSVLNVGGNGQMGYIEIPSINVRLGIFHGTDDSVLQTSVGHVEWSSLPVGGANSHCVLSGHRGLPSAKLFTNLDQLKEGDLFMLRILDEVLTYKVYKISVVLPDDINELMIVPDRDICTLVTCTPYGINTHRLLVHGYRVETAEEAVISEVHVTSEMIQVEEMIVAGVMIIGLLIIMMVMSVFRRKGRKSEIGDLDEIQKALKEIKKKK